MVDKASSILSGSTSFPKQNQGLGKRALPCPPTLEREQGANSPNKLGENTGSLFGRRSRPPPQRETAAPAGTGNGGSQLGHADRLNTYTNAAQRSIRTVGLPTSPAANIEATIARDRRISDIWRLVADGKLDFDRAAELTGGRERQRPEPSPTIDKPRSIRRRADPARAKRLIARKKLAAGAVPPNLVGELTVSEQAVAAVIANQCRMKSRSCTLAVSTLATRAFVSTRSVQLALKKLELLGLIACLRRPRPGQKHATNRIMVTSLEWREHIWKHAAIARLDRVKKSAPEKDSNYNYYPLNSTDGLGEKSARRTVASNRPRRHIWTTPKSEAWLDRFRKAAGDTLNPGAIGLHDPGPITKWLNRGFTEADVLAGITAVRRRHEGGERQQTV